MGLNVRLGIDIDGVTAIAQSDYDIYGRPSSGLEWWLPEVYKDAEVMPGAVEGLTELIADGHKVHMITARAPHEATSEWLNRNGVPFHSLHFTRAKWSIPCHVYLDDGPQFLNGIYERGLTGVRFRYPYNANACAKHAVDSWPEFVALIRSGVRGRMKRNPRKLFDVVTV